MAASNVGQFSINVKSNLKDFYGEVEKSKASLKDLTARKNQLNIDSKQLDDLRKKSQAIALEMRNLTNQKRDIKLGLAEGGKKELDELDVRIQKLRGQKLQIDTDIQPIRTANVELYKVEKEIDRVNANKMTIDVRGALDSLSNVSNKIGDIILGLGAKGIAGALAGITAVAGVGGAGLVSSVKAAGNLEQQVGGVEALFGNDANIVKQNANAAYLTAGTSASDYMENATSFAASLISGLEGDTQKAAQVTDKAMRDMSDNANRFGTSIDMIRNTYQGLSKDNFTMLDNLKLGFGGTQAEMARMINETGVMGEGFKATAENVKNVPFDKMIEAIGVVQDRLNVTGTTAKEAMSTLEGSMGAAKAAWSNFLATGENSDAVVDTFLNTAKLAGKMASELAPKLLKGIKSAFEKIKPQIPQIIEKTISNGIGVLNDVFGLDIDTKVVTDKVKEFYDKISSFSWKEAFAGFKESIDDLKPIFDVVMTIFKKLTGMAGDIDSKQIGAFLPNMLKLGAGFKVLGGSLKLASKFNIPNISIPSFSLGGLGKMSGEAKQIGVADLKELGLKMLTIAGISGNIWLAAKALQEVSKVPSLGADIALKLATMGVAIVGMGALAIVASKIPKDVALSGLLTIAGISADIWLAAKALQEVDKVPKLGKDIALKLATIGVAIVAIGTLAAVIGGIEIATGGLAAAAIAAGLLTMIAIAESIAITASSFSKLEKMNLNEDKISNSIKIINNLIYDISKSSMTESILSKIKGLFSSLIDSGIVSNITKTAYKLFGLQNINLNSDALKKNIKAIDESIYEISDTSITDDIIGKVTGLFATFIESGVVSNIAKIAENLGKIQGINIDAKALVDRMKAIEESISAMSDTSITNDVIGKIKGLFSTFLETKITDNLLKIGDSLTKLQNVKLNKEEIIKNIKTIIEAISNISDTSITNDVIGKIKGVISTFLEAKILNNLIKISDGLTKIQSSKLDAKAVKANIKTIEESISNISDTSITNDILGKIKGIIATLLESKVIENLAQVGTELKTIEGFELNKDIISEAIKSIIKCLDDIGNSSLGNLDIGTLVTNINSFIEKGITSNIAKIGVDLKSIQDLVLDPEVLGKSVDAIKKSIEKVGELKLEGGILDNVKKLINSFIDAKIFSNLASMAKDMKVIEKNIVDFQTVLDVVDEIKAIINHVNSDGGLIDTLISFLKEKIDTKDLKDISDIFKSLSALSESLLTLQGYSEKLDSKKVVPVINVIVDAITALSSASGTKTVVNLKGLSEALVEVINTLTDKYPKDFKELGKTYATNMTDAFKENLKLSSKVDKQIEKIQKSSSKMTEIGNDFGTKLGDALANTFKSKSASITDTIKSAINSALSEKYKVDVDANVNKKETTSSSAAAAIRQNSMLGGERIPFAEGGLIQGADVLTGYGKDTIPIAAQRGEYMMPELATRILGVDFMNDLRNLDVSRAFSRVSNRISNATSNVVNHIYNNQTSQDINMQVSGGSDLVFKANRRLRI